MTRTEFDSQVREMKSDRSKEINAIATIQAEIKESIAAKNRQIAEFHKDVEKHKQMLQGLNQQRIKVETKWNDEINAFIDEYEPSTTSNLAEASTLNIVYELRRRGFKGIIDSIDTETGDIESYDLSKQFGHEDGETQANQD